MWYEGETLSPGTFCKPEDHECQVSRASATFLEYTQESTIWNSLDRPVNEITVDCQQQSLNKQPAQATETTNPVLRSEEQRQSFLWLIWMKLKHGGSIFCDEAEQSDKAEAAERVQHTKWKNVDKPDENWSLRSMLSGDETSPGKRGRSSWQEDKSWEQERSPSLAHWYQHMAVVQRLELVAQQKQSTGRSGRP